MNLCINARDVMPDGGTIILKTVLAKVNSPGRMSREKATNQRYVCLMVEDTGPGMNAEIKSKIFEPFFTTKEVDKGTGMGLAVVFSIVTQHNGFINVYSEPGHGAIFKIYFPAIAQLSNQEISGTRKSEILAGSGERILIIEDDESVNQLVSDVLLRNNYQIESAICAKDAERIFRENAGEFDIVLSDVILPDGNGFKLVEDLYRINPAIKILLTSGYTDIKFQASIFKTGHFKFIQKPFDVDELLKTVKALSKQKMH